MPRRALPVRQARASAAAALAAIAAAAAAPPRTPMQTRASTASTSARPTPSPSAGKSTTTSARSKSSLLSPQPLPGRQLRSRLVPLTPAGAAGSGSGSGSHRSHTTTAANASCVRGRRRSQSVSSAVVAEDVCTAVQAGRAAAQAASQSRMPQPARTRSGTSGSMRIHWRGARTWRGRGETVPSSQTDNHNTNKQNRKTNVRPKADEQLISCIYAGCYEKFPADEIAAHLSKCSSCLPCPLACHDHCGWQGAISHGVEHILKDHRAVTSKPGPSAVVSLKNWKRAVPMQWITLQACLGQNFLVVLQKVLIKNTCPMFFGTVRIFGSQEDADRFEFRMMLKTRGTVGRTFSYSSVVRALHEEEAAVRNGDCFVFDSSYADIFSCEDNLEVEVSISVMKM